jgi:hypothetical protein
MAAGSSTKGERQAIQAELKATLVTLASAVAHDVNHHLEVLVELGAVDCQRIFSNMLRVARNGRAEDGSPVDLNQVVRETVPSSPARRCGAASRRCWRSPTACRP